MGCAVAGMAVLQREVCTRSMRTNRISYILLFVQVIINCFGFRTKIFLLNIDTMVRSEKSFAGVGGWLNTALVRLGLVRNSPSML